MARESIFDKLNTLLSELVPLPQQTQLKVMDTQKQQTVAKANRVVEPISEKKATQPQAEIVRQTTIVQTPPMNSSHLHQRLQSAESLRESIIISEILAKPVSMRKK